MNDWTQAPTGPCPENPAALDHRWIETQDPEADHWICGDCLIINRMIRVRARERREVDTAEVNRMAGSKQELLEKMEKA